MSNHKLPRFDDFLSDMGDDRVMSWHEDALRTVPLEIGFSFDITNPDDSKRFVSALAAFNQRTTVLMLRDYHDWLCTQLENSSLRLI